MSRSHSPWSRAERKGDETKETQRCLQLLLAFCCNVCEIPADEVITPQHVLLLAWPVIAAVSVYPGTQMKNILSVQTATETSRWPKPSVQLLLYRTGRTARKGCVLRDSKSRRGTQRDGGELTRHWGLMLVKVQQALWSQQGGSVYVLWPANFVSACSSFRLISSSANGWMWDESITHGSKPAGETTPCSYKSSHWRPHGCTFGESYIFLFMNQIGGFHLRSKCCSPRKIWSKPQTITFWAFIYFVFLKFIWDTLEWKNGNCFMRDVLYVMHICSHHQLDRGGITVQKSTVAHPLKCVKMPKW